MLLSSQLKVTRYVVSPIGFPQSPSAALYNLIFTTLLIGLCWCLLLCWCMLNQYQGTERVRPVWKNVRQEIMRNGTGWGWGRGKTHRFLTCVNRHDYWVEEIKWTAWGGDKTAAAGGKKHKRPPCHKGVKQMGFSNGLSTFVSCVIFLK